MNPVAAVRYGLTERDQTTWRDHQRPNAPEKGASSRSASPCLFGYLRDAERA